jgi:hypothetical protein
MRFSILVGLLAAILLGSALLDLVWNPSPIGQVCGGQLKVIDGREVCRPIETAD